MRDATWDGQGIVRDIEIAIAVKGDVGVPLLASKGDGDVDIIPDPKGRLRTSRLLMRVNRSGADRSGNHRGGMDVRLAGIRRATA